VIRIESVVIKEFRGIRDLTLHFKGQNFGICGPNGTGKSGVVDALDFALTGNVSRLSGEGRGDISLKSHGPHVDSRNAPDKARVTVKVSIPSLSKTVTIERTVKAPAKAVVTPSDDAILAVLAHLQSHPEVVLSRRELIKYVLATPGDRAKEVQALLHLDQVEQVRAGFQKIANACERDSKALSAVATDAGQNLLKALDIPTLVRDQVLLAANTQRAVLGLAPLSELTDATSLKDGLAATEPKQTQRIPKVQAQEDIKAARDHLAEWAGHATEAQIATALAELRALSSDPAIANGVTLENFYSTGLGLIAAEECPFCDTAWDLTALKRHIQAKVALLQEAASKRKTAEGTLIPLIALLRREQSCMDALGRHAANGALPLIVQAIHERRAACSASINTISAFLPVADTIAAVDKLSSVPKQAYEAIAALEKVVAELPEPSRQGAARDWLTVAQERLEQYRAAKRNQKAATEHATRARQVSDLYAAASDGVLAGIYESVQSDFAALYGFINRDDEEKFSAKLIPSMGKLGFDVDFYGRGFFPPGAYHSEGHQDGMGLCLYLALMRHLNGPAFTVAILDDVLMSVDAGHRREVCAVLKREFPNTQFVMTTHDPIWLHHMRTENLINGRASAVRFRRWDVDHGPVEWDDRDVWTEIDDHLKLNDVRAAASLLRHYLEYVSAELCHRLRVPVEYRGDAQHQLGDLLPPAIAHVRKIHANAKAAANSWNQKDRVAEVEALEARFNALAAASQAEQWQINVAVHYNAWDSLRREDFGPVAEAYRDLLGGFACANCSELLRVTPERETREALRCDCGKTNVNLQLKPK
jgi:recombinational DNA repair ATPase RecF